MHPFALNDTQLDQVSGGIAIGGCIIPLPVRPLPYPKPRDPIEYTTMAIGEEGGAPPVDLT